MCSGSLLLLSLFKQQRPSIRPADEEQNRPTVELSITVPLHSEHTCHHEQQHTRQRPVKRVTIIESYLLFSVLVAAINTRIKHQNKQSRFPLVVPSFHFHRLKSYDILEQTCDRKLLHHRFPREASEVCAAVSHKFKLTHSRLHLLPLVVSDTQKQKNVTVHVAYNQLPVISYSKIEYF